MHHSTTVKIDLRADLDETCSAIIAAPTKLIFDRIFSEVVPTAICGNKRQKANEQLRRLGNDGENERLQTRIEIRDAGPISKKPTATLTLILL